MTKSELIQRLTKRFPRLTQREIEQIVSRFLGEITSSLANDGRVELRGFGAFSVRKREARKARNPKNGEEVKVGTRYSVYFRTGKELRERIKSIVPANES